MKAPLFLCLALLLPAAASATNPNFQYDYLDLEHLSMSPTNGKDGKGPAADFSYTVLDGVQFRAGYQRFTFDNSLLTGKDYDFGFTGEDGINDTTDIYTDVLYLNHSKAPASTGTESGYRIGIGLRHRAWQRVEVDGYVAHDFLDTSMNEVGVGLMVDATSWLAFGVAYAHDNTQTSTTALRLRLYF